MDKSRRRLISGGWQTHAEEPSRVKAPTKVEHYFDSFEYCYPLLASAGSLLIEEAHAIGIDTRRKSKEAIARELFERGFTYPKRV